MERKGKDVVGVPVERLLEKLNRALADEWLAYYQYWVGAKVIRGVLRGPAVAELTQHAADELRHAGLLADRIVQTGGTPLLKPEDWYRMTNCGYDAPEDPAVKAILLQNIKGEQCAIKVYRELVEYTKDKDPITYEMALSILADEVEHEDDLINLVEDMESK